MKPKWNFQRGEWSRLRPKTIPWEGYGHFLLLNKLKERKVRDHAHQSSAKGVKTSFKLGLNHDAN